MKSISNFLTRLNIRADLFRCIWKGFFILPQPIYMIILKLFSGEFEHLFHPPHNYHHGDLRIRSKLNINHHDNNCAGDKISAQTLLKKILELKSWYKMFCNFLFWHTYPTSKHWKQITTNLIVWPCEQIAQWHKKIWWKSHVCII